MSDINSIEDVFDLAGKVIIVTGGGVGIGKVYSESLTAVGAKVVIADIADNEAKDLSARLNDAGAETMAHTTDVADEASAEAMAGAAIEAFGRIDGLVNNAALYVAIEEKPWNQVPSDEWDRLMQVNLKGTYNCCKAVYPQMKRQGKGKIVNIGSGTWLSGANRRIHYTASKAAIVGFSRALSHAIGADGINVNVLSPGSTRSETLDQVTTEEFWARRQHTMEATSAMKRYQVPEDLIGGLMFLLSSASDFMSGQNLNIDGGRNHL